MCKLQLHNRKFLITKQYTGYQSTITNVVYMYNVHGGEDPGIPPETLPSVY